jgi:hypothetical protein
VTVIFATVALTLVAACTSSPSSAGAGSAPAAGASTSAGTSISADGSTDSPSAVAYSQCLRSRGVPNYPDPGSGGALPKGSAQSFGVSDSQFQAAENDCQHLLPTGGSFEQQSQQCFSAGDCPQALVQQILTAQRKFAQCMRSHGVLNWPDPTISTNGAPIFKLDSVGITHSQTHSPPMLNTINECVRLDPAPVAMASN